MRIFWIGIGSLALLIGVVAPHVASERCKDRWSPINLEGVWSYQTGCSVKIGSNLIREEYVTIDRSGRANPLAPQAGAPTIAHPDWVTVSPKR